jgi:hypothetical protein
MSSHRSLLASALASTCLRLAFVTIFSSSLLASEEQSLAIHDQYKDAASCEQGPVVTHPFVRTKVLAAGYERLCEAIEANDMSTAHALFKEFPGLKKFSYQPVGTPLHFVRSLDMARLLTEKIGVSVNVCDEWGETPSYAIQQSKPDRFTSPEEQKAIALYFKKREAAYQKLKSQLLCNKNLHMKLSVMAMTGVLVTQLAVLTTIFLKNIKTLKGV